MSEKNIVDRTKVKNERVDEIKRKEQDINKELFKYYFSHYQSPSNMYEKLIETNEEEIN